MLSVKQNLGKRERIKSKIEVDLLFREGQSFFCFPFKLVYLLKDIGSEQSRTKLLVSIPKRKFKKAVDRNLIRRRIKEAYRQSKNELELPDKGKELLLSFIYAHDEIRDFNELQKRLALSLHKLNVHLESHK
ncbi:MAG: ribonuclease P protein component [Crocinitomicaceae bacterium]|nr:ribonuclease P protein component [Crocinitomicaceae bacterium]|tara:strand:+ start:1420 stop:1815 length:396 start_codon:yes stop_codon:yes gene_type:complete